MENEVLIERAKAFVQAVEAPCAEIEPFYASDVSQEEFPNRLLPKGTVRYLEALREASAKGRKVIKAQTIEIVNAVLDRHACDRLRHAETRRPIARPLRPNLRADGLIWRQRNYDCFEAW